MGLDLFDFTLVTPVYKDARRLAVYGPHLARALSDSGLRVRWVISDDGSGAAHHADLQTQAADYRNIHVAVEVFGLEVHRGKGAAVREAWKAFPAAVGLAFVDADGSIDAQTVVALLRQAAEGGPGRAVLASRRQNAGTQIERGWFRGVVNACYAWLVGVCLGLGVRDPQCGLKVIPWVAFDHVSPVLREDGLAFDSELLAALRQHGVDLREAAIDWADRPGGQVRPLRDAGPMLAALLKIAWRCRTGGLRPD